MAVRVAPVQAETESSSLAEPSSHLYVSLERDSGLSRNAPGRNAAGVTQRAIIAEIVVNGSDFQAVASEPGGLRVQLIRVGMSAFLANITAMISPG